MKLFALYLHLRLEVLDLQTQLLIRIGLAAEYIVLKVMEMRRDFRVHIVGGVRSLLVLCAR